MKKLLIFTFLIALPFSGHGQEIAKHPLDGAWKWTSTDDDGKEIAGFRWYWTDQQVGIHRVVDIMIDSETREPIRAWSVFQLPASNGIGSRLWLDTEGRIGRSTERFGKQGSSVTFAGATGSSNASGVIELSWNGSGDQFEERIEHFIGFGQAYVKETPVVKAHRIDYSPREKGEVAFPEVMNPLVDARLGDLIGSWESSDQNGKVNLRIRFNQYELGRSLLEKWVFLDGEGEANGAGFNLTRRDPTTGQIVMWSIGSSGFSQNGGWDFLGGSTTGQRQNEGRLVRSFLSEDVIHARWQSKENGEFVNQGNGYILKRVPVEDKEGQSNNQTRSYHQRTLEANRFAGFIRTDFKIVKERDEAAYLAAEREWKGLHEQIMKKGGLLHWHLAKIHNAQPGEPNYATVQVYASMEDMQDGGIWDRLDYSAVGSREALGQRTWPYVTSTGSDIHQAMDQIRSSDSRDKEVGIINQGYMTVMPGKRQAYLAAETGVAKPLWNLVSSMDSSFRGWAIHRLVESSREGVQHDFRTLHFKTKNGRPDQGTWQSNIQAAAGMLKGGPVEWNELRVMKGVPHREIVMRTNRNLHPVRMEWNKLKGAWKHTYEDGSYRIKRISQGTEQLEYYDAKGSLTGKGVVPMRIEVKGGLNHFYAFHPNGTYHSIYKIHHGKWYEQFRGIWREGNATPDAFLVYEKLE